MFQMPDANGEGDLDIAAPGTGAVVSPLSVVAAFAGRQIRAAMEQPSSELDLCPRYESFTRCLCDVEKLLDEPLQSAHIAQAYDRLLTSLQLWSNTQGIRYEAM